MDFLPLILSISTLMYWGIISVVHDTTEFISTALKKSFLFGNPLASTGWTQTYKLSIHTHTQTQSHWTGVYIDLAEFLTLWQRLLRGADRKCENRTSEQNAISLNMSCQYAERWSCGWIHIMIVLNSSQQAFITGFYLNIFDLTYTLTFK